MSTLSNQIALDVMGGDHAPRAAIAGALAACSPLGTVRMAPDRVRLVGDEATIGEMLEELGGNPGFAVQHAAQKIEMGDSPAQALRAKPDSSIAGCVRAIREGKAAALVSMGNTGACVGASTLGLGSLAGVRRPGIAVTLELTGHPLTILDMGANIAPRPQDLCQYAAMGSIYMRDCLGIKDPRIGLLNVGEEKGKGTGLLKEAYPLLEDGSFDFIGNIEGSDLFRGECDVVVTDGFTGNVILKLLEQFSGFLLGLVMEQLAAREVEWGGDALKTVGRSIDYSTYGGALLLGVKGVVVIGHGRSDEQAVANAIGLAGRAVDAGVNEHIEQGLSAVS
jgi:phosphate acyltransferase